MIEAPHPGDRIGPYRIDSLVKDGGMASVFRGTDVRTGDPVAIKIPHPDMECDPLFFDRFQREAEIGRKLDHPGVVKVLPGENSGRVCMVMPWVEGRSLRQILDQENKLAPERAQRIALRICDVLGYIHSHGVVHRDLKPENLMLDADDRVTLIDFGIAGVAGVRRLTFAKLSKAMGTPDYVSPEQVKGKRGDARSDIYSAGVIFYEMLTGQVPFRGANPLVILNQRLFASAAPVRELAPEISDGLEEVTRRALERDPTHRYANAQDFAWDLEHPARVEAAKHPTDGPAKSPRPRTQPMWTYVALALIPVVIFVLLCFVASRQ
jgi:eukaryotic-like serine/threonine-protein kinase